jgi:hypothetical protein
VHDARAAGIGFGDAPAGAAALDTRRGIPAPPPGGRAVRVIGDAAGTEGIAAALRAAADVAAVL